MFCVSIKEKSFERCALILRNVQMGEIRADLCGFSAKQVEELCAVNRNVIVTCRIGPQGTGAEHSAEVLCSAIAAGAAYIDIEMEAGEEFIAGIRGKMAAETKLIVSYHNFDRTLSIGELKSIYKRCIALGADIVKIVTTALSEKDADTTLSLYSEVEAPNALVAFSMGEIGAFSREKSLKLGAPYTYVSLSKDEETAPGQPTIFCHFK